MTDRIAGVLVPLFSLRTADDLGRGEFEGLLPMGEFALAMGHRMIQLLPIDELASGQTSPYSALSVFALDPIYISMGGLPGVDPKSCAAARAELRCDGVPVDQVRLRARKSELLAQAYDYFKSRAGRGLRDECRQFTESQRDWLDDYTLFRALRDKLGAEWESWPAPLRTCKPAALADARLELARPIAMLEYTQFLAHRQWRSIRQRLHGTGVLLGGDLAFSPCRESAEVWAHQELFDLDRSVGAPPDAFSKSGQRWGLPMPDWQRMRARDFDFLRRRMRHARELFDLLRIDHVVGLFRTYGYPLGEQAGGAFDPSGEPAQRAQGTRIMRVLHEEAGPMEILAEDLGVIPGFVRETLAALSIPGYKVMRWEKAKRFPDSASAAASRAEHYTDPATYPVVSLATTGTHDTDTLIEWWASIDTDERRRFAEDLHIADRLDCGRTPLNEASLDAIIEALYASPARFAVTPIQDLYGWDARINYPGSVSAANWTWRLPFDLEQRAEQPNNPDRTARLHAICRRTGRFQAK
ncbi:MAG TPA: 4-alpha-glucanotransferase [Candidatus Binataceae bacterium]|nr:4-alpha-glucanotransferase [Candidatus Binataceae bacterium]